MASSSGVPFCERCGSLLSLPDANPIVCGTCDHRMRFEDFAVRIVTCSKPKPDPAWVREFMGEATGGPDKRSTQQTIEEPCPKCGHGELLFYTMQLRSVDEGATVFYECPKCAHRYSQNN